MNDIRNIHYLKISNIIQLHFKILILYIHSFLAIVQKRLKKEKKAKRKLQEALEFETKRREQAEQTLKQAASTDSLRVLNGKKVYIYASPTFIFNTQRKI